MPQLQAVLGPVEVVGAVAWVLLLHHHIAALGVLITPVQAWGGWEQVTTGHHSTGRALGARGGVGGDHSPEQLFRPLATSGRGAYGKRGRETSKSRVSPPSAQRERGREKAGESGSHQILKERSCIYVGFKNTWTVIRAGEGKTTVSTLPEGLTKETLDC